jgi:hypothetical protein
MELEAAFAFAISNIAAFGDTDVFPSPFERFLFADLHDKARFLLQEMHHNCDSHLASFPPQNFDMLCPVGYTGFRWVTQIDPIWNAYFLGLVVSIADTIEKSRIAEGERVVFSYRFSPNPETKHLFSDSSWFDFKRRSLELAKQYEFVLVTDIADFYPRVYHHRLENELRRLNLKSDIPSRIMKLLSHFSKTVSYGLPVGGPAARILAELVLRPIDLHLHRRQIPFCRYADDFALFVRSKEEAFGAVALLSDKLFNEGLSLQRNKTRILPSKEFIETSRLIHPLDHTENEAMSPEIVLLGLSVRYDPYSPTADEDYEALKDAVSNIDIVGILSREINKTNIDSQVTKQAIAAVRALGPTLRHEAIGDPKLASAIIAASERIGRLKNQKIQMLPSEEELQEADDLLKVYFEFFRSFEHRLEFRPKFPGLGILSATEADICSHTYICEVKTVTRGISMSDIRQLLTYCALGLASDRSSWVNGLFFNPRSAVYYRFDIRGMPKRRELEGKHLASAEKTETFSSMPFKRLLMGIV